MNKVAKLIKESFFTTTPLQLLKDLFGGIIVALVSIPISIKNNKGFLFFMFNIIILTKKLRKIYI